MNCLKSKSRNSETSENEYIVKNDKIKEYEKLKTCLIRKKKIKALLFSLLSILKVGFYYLDIVTDIQLSVKYFEASNIKNSNLLHTRMRVLVAHKKTHGGVKKLNFI